MTCTVAVSLLLVLALGLVCGGYSKRVSREFQGQSALLSAAIRAGDWDTAQDAVDQLEKKWEKTGDRLALWVNHADLDEAGVSLRRLRVAVEEKDRAHGLVFAAELYEALELIYFRDAFSLKNIW